MWPSSQMRTIIRNYNTLIVKYFQTDSGSPGSIRMRDYPLKLLSYKNIQIYAV